MAGVLLGRMDRLATVEVAGGTLGVNWRAGDGHVTLTGPAAPIYRGSIVERWPSR